MGHNRNINPANAKPLLNGLQKIGLNAELIDDAYIVVNVPPKFRKTSLSGETILIKIGEVIAAASGSAVPPAVEGGLVVGNDGVPSQYIIINPGDPGDVLTIVDGVPVWQPGGANEAPLNGIPYSRQDANWVPAGLNIYDGIDTEATILASDPTALLGEVWWASDTKNDIRAVASLAYGDHWQIFGALQYIPGRETFALPETADGHTVNVGEETFVAAFNTDATGATILNPEVFAVIGVNAIDEGAKDVIKVIASDVSDSVIFGINTTEAPIGGLTKITTFGSVRGVDTSLWPIYTVLYIDPVIKGGLTSVKPVVNAFIIGFSLKQDAVEGIIEVISGRAIDKSLRSIPSGVAASWFTGGLSAQAPFYDALNGSKGTVASVSQTVAVDDDEKLPVPVDFITLPFQVETTINPGEVAGEIAWEVDNAGSAKKIYIETYLANNAGGVIDVDNEEPVGDLGVRPFVSTESAILDPAANVPVSNALIGFALSPVTIEVGQRLRHHVLFEKIGAVGGAYTFTLYHGSDWDSYLAVPQPIALNDLSDVSITVPTNDQVLTYDAVSGNWVNKDATGGSGAAPGGANQMVQFNDNGTFGGAAAILHDKVTGITAFQQSIIIKSDDPQILLAKLDGTPLLTISAGLDDVLKINDFGSSIDVMKIQSDTGNINFFGIVETPAVMIAANFQLGSDMRDKTKVADLGEGLFKYFSYNRGNEPLRHGVSAQEVRKTHPELVSKNAKGKLSVSYIDMLLLEVAELNKRLAKLEG